jgi:predicted phage terminase large subunit-like protein
MIQIQQPRINSGPFLFGATKTHKEVLSFRAFVNRVNPRYRWYPYVERLAAVLEEVAAGRIDRLMIFAPPRHGKSELVSRLFSAYYLYRNPSRWVGINSYSAELAYTFSRNARDNYSRVGGTLRDDAYAVKQWETGKGGGLWAAGVGGPITGKGFHLGIIDDPIKNAEDAGSLVIRDKQWDWYQSTFYTRQEPDAAIVVIQTRWHEDDLSGRLIASEVDAPEGWTVLHLEAIKDDESPNYPATMTLLPDERKPNTALNSERYPLDKLEKIRQRIGLFFFGALYQQRPRPRDGGMFKREWFEVIKTAPRMDRLVRYWDKAGTKDAGAYSAGVLIGRAKKEFIVLDVIMGQWEASVREGVISQTLATDKAAYGHVVTYVEQEPGSGGKESAESTVRNNPGYAVKTDRPTGDKATRAEPFASQAGIGNVKLLAAAWNQRYLDILTSFPKGAVKDPVDGSSGAFFHVSMGSNGLPPTAGLEQISKWKV